jgi:hypothetical protein
MPDQTRPIPSPDPAPWLIGPADLAAIRSDDRLLDRLGRGERPDQNDRDPIGALLALWLAEVDDTGGARWPPLTATLHSRAQRPLYAP